MNQPHRRHARESGAALIEFAMVSLALYLILAAILTFGSAVWIGQNLQQAVDTGAQELARLPLPPNRDLGWGDLERNNVFSGSGFVADEPRVTSEIYDEQFLVITQEEIADAGFDGPTALFDYADAKLPLLNRLLVPVMIFDRQHAGGVWRYPGAVVQNSVTEQETVLVPVVDNNSVTWVAPVEEIRVDHDSNPATAKVGPFSVIPPAPAEDLPPGFVPGVVALRINYPFQSAAMSSFTPDTESAFEPNVGGVRSANDATVAAGASGVYALQVDSNSYSDGEPNIHGGRYGLGRQIALPFDRDSIRTVGVRPYRRILSVQAIYRREVFN